jgi:TubC N-terminal docking domain
VTAADLVRDLHERGVTLVADGATLRCRPKSALSAADLAALKALKSDILATLQRPATRITCYSCRGHRFWLSVHGVTVCAVCHSPADPSLVAKWITTDGGVGA